MSLVPPRRRKLIATLNLLIMLTAIVVGGIVVYQAANPNAGMLNCPTGTTKILSICFKDSCGLIFLGLLAGLLAGFALLMLFCDLLNLESPELSRDCRDAVALVTSVLIGLLLLFSFFFCPSWP